MPHYSKNLIRRAERLIRPDTEIERLVLLLSDILEDLRRIILDPARSYAPNEYVLLYDRLLVILNQLNGLKPQVQGWVDRIAKQQYDRGILLADEMAKEIGLLGALHPRATLLEISMLQQFSAGLSGAIINPITKIENTVLAYATRIRGFASSAALSQVAFGQEAVRVSILGTGVRDLERTVMATLFADAQGGLVEVAGKKWQVEKYVRMLARFHTAAAQSRATEARLSGYGVDLLQVSTHNAQCPICAPLEGLIVSLSGKSKEYPPISILPNGGAPFHPNCRHAMMGIVVELADSGDFTIHADRMRGLEDAERVNLDILGAWQKAA